MTEMSECTSFGLGKPSQCCRPSYSAITSHQHPLRSAPISMEWEKYTASVDVLDCQRACTDPSETHPSKRMALNTICPASTSNTGPASPESFKTRTPDRLTVDLAEYRKGYCYSVDTPDKMPDPENYTPSRVLDKEDSNDFSSFAGLQEGPATAALFSPCSAPASSPFAAHTRQPFADAVSCRSNLSDYGYDTASDDGEDEDDGAVRIGFESGQEHAAQPDPCPHMQPPDEHIGFWADVGASGKLTGGSADADRAGAHLRAGTGDDAVQWEVNGWESGSDASEQPDEDMEGGSAPGLGQHLHNTGVLLPWDMD